MIAVRRSADRRFSLRGKLSVSSTFFPDDRTDHFSKPFGGLAALDEMRLPPGGVCPPRSRGDAVVVTYLYRGRLAQESTNGCSAVMHAGEFHVVSAAHGAVHKEANASHDDWLHLFRLTLEPGAGEGDVPQEHRWISSSVRRNALSMIASPDGRGGSLRLGLDAVVCSSLLDEGRHIAYELGRERRAWIHVIHGAVIADDLVLSAGDGAGIAISPAVSLMAQEETEILLIDLGPAPARAARE